MDIRDPGWAAAMWGAVGIGILACARWVLARIIVPRDALQQRILEDMAKDISAIRETVCGQGNILNSHGERLARLEGRCAPGSNPDGRP